MASMLKAALAATAMTVSGGMAAQAVPTFVNPTFLQGQATQPDGTFGYATVGNNGTATGWTSTSSQGAVGVSGKAIAGQAQPAPWDNGAAPNGTPNVEFFQIQGNGLSQTVSGFVQGNTYTFSIQANIRAATGGAPKLGITVNGVDYSNGGFAVGESDPMATYATPFATFTSVAWTATSTSATIAFLNDGGPGGPNADVTLDVGNAQIQQVAAVPEPASLLLLGIGIAGVAVVRRRVSSAV